MFKDLVYENRTCRRFDESHPVERQTLLYLVDLARVTASAGNLQPLKYMAVGDQETNARVFARLGWAGYLPLWPGPEPGERPGAYIIILLDTRIAQNADCDCGIAAQTILLGARDKGLAGCMIQSVNTAGLSRDLKIGESFKILMVVALGKPVEQVRMDPMGADGNMRYTRDENQVHHVPKRELKEILLK